jgi:hypothetical protein
VFTIIASISRSTAPSFLRGLRGYSTSHSIGPERKVFECFGGPGEIRTHDLFHAMEARSQLRHRPDPRYFFNISCESANMISRELESK